MNFALSSLPIVSSDPDTSAINLFLITSFCAETELPKEL